MFDNHSPLHTFLRRATAACCVGDGRPDGWYGAEMGDRCDDKHLGVYCHQPRHQPHEAQPQGERCGPKCSKCSMSWSTTGVIRWPCGNFRCPKEGYLCCCTRRTSYGVKYVVSLSGGVARESKVYPPALLLVRARSWCAGVHRQ